MPAILERLVSQLKAKGMSADKAWPIATATLQKAGDLKAGSREATPRGIKRGLMSPAARAKDRAARASTHSTKDYGYDSKTNRATLRRGLPRG